MTQPSSTECPRISGFTIVRNAGLLKYPFLESVRSVLPLCDEFIINCGDSADATAAMCEALVRESGGKVRVLHSVWERERQSGGYQLKAQTDRALEECRGQWCLYIQADEAMHEADRDRIREAMARADRREDVDGLVFDYLHFYGSYEYHIKGRNWYRREVRVFKNHRGITAFRDAQGFRKGGKRLKALHCGGRVFHYGYVRTPDSLQVKNSEMARWWGENPSRSAEDYALVRHVGLRRYRDTHPAVMAERIAHLSPDFDPRRCRRRWDRNEIKNAITLLWESVIPYRIGEFRNYDLV